MRFHPQKGDRKQMTSDQTLDCYGLLCPMPIIQTAQKIKQMKVGEILEVLATDKGILEDMPAWCRQTGQEFLGIEQEGEMFKAYVKKIRD
jgi:tRNA 2-thiouridine synthesizing protein A